MNINNIVDFRSFHISQQLIMKTPINNLKTKKNEKEIIPFDTSFYAIFCD